MSTEPLVNNVLLSVKTAHLPLVPAHHALILSEEILAAIALASLASSILEPSTAQPALPLASPAPMDQLVALAMPLLKEFSQVLSAIALLVTMSSITPT